MSKLERAAEYVNNIKNRAKNPEGAFAGFPLAWVSPVVVEPLRLGLVEGMQELDRLPKNLESALIVGAIAIANLASVRKEADTLEEKDYAASPVASIAYTAIGKPRLASGLTHLFNYGQSLFNPISAYAIATDNYHLLVQNLIASSLVLPIWRYGVNTLISKGAIDPILNPIKNAREWAVKGVKNKFGSKIKIEQAVLEPETQTPQEFLPNQEYLINEQSNGVSSNLTETKNKRIYRFPEINK